MATDGTLRFNTKIDASGFDKGTKSLSSKVIDLKNKIQSTETEIKNLKAELEKTGDVKVKTKTAESIEKDLAKANEKVRNYSARQDEIIQETKNNLGSLYDDQSLEYLLKQNSEWVKLDKEINQTWADVEKYKRDLEQVNAAAPLTKDTAEYQNKEQKLTELSGKLEVYQAKLREAENAEKNSNAQHKRASGSLKDIKARLSSTISGLKMFTNGAKKAGNVLKTAFSKTAGKAISSIRERFKKANSSTNVLEKSLRRIKNTLVRMFFFRLVHSPIDAVKEGLGEISKISPELNKNLSALKTETTYLKNSLAAMAAPIVNLLAPAFTSFFQLLSNVTDKAGQLAAVLTGQSYTKAVKVQQNYAASLDESTKSADKNTKAMEKNQRALAGFDELNVLDQNDESDAEESSSASTPMFENVGNAISDLSGRLVDAIRNQDFGAVGQMIGEKINGALEKIKWGKIKTTAKKWAGNIADLLNGFIASTDWALVGETISNGIQTAFLAASTFLQKFDFSAVGKALGTVINQLASPETAKLIAKTLSSLISGIFSTLISLINTIDWGKVSDSIISLISNFDFSKISGLAIKLLNSIATALRNIKFDAIGKAFSDGLSKIDWRGVWKSAINAAGSLMKGIGKLFGFNIDTSKAEKALNNLAKPVENLLGAFKTLAEGVLPLITNNLLPTAVKLIGDIFQGISPIVSALTPIISSALGAVDRIVSALSPVLATIGEVVGTILEILSPILDIVFDLVAQVVENLAPALDDVLKLVDVMYEAAKPFVNIIADVLQPIIDTIGSLTKYLGGLIKFITGVFSGDWSQAWDGIKQTFEGAFDFIKNYGKTILEFIQSRFELAWEGIKTAWSGATSFFGTIWNGIQEVFAGVAIWFGNRFVDAVDAIKKGWSGLPDFFSTLWGGICEVIKAPINWIIDGINTIIGGLNSLAIDVPDWVPFVGGQHWGISIPEIPKLAQGTFIPANYGEFLAVLGDNKREAEVVSPISAMKQAFLEAMAERRNNDEGEQVINLYIGEEKFFTWIVGMNNRFAKQHGYSALSGGVDL